MKTLPYLQLDKIKYDPKVGKLVPREIAYKYHALPVSCDGSKVTIAISSNHNDIHASKLLASTIGLPVCFVQADAYAIDHRLEEIWKNPPEKANRLLLWYLDTSCNLKIIHYGEKLAELIHGELNRFGSHSINKETRKDFVRTIENYQPDLIMIEDQLGGIYGKKYQNFMTGHKVSGLPASVLSIKNPRWPLRNLLLILTDSGPSSDIAIEWASDFAKASRAAVTILVVLPPVPLMYGNLLQYCVPELMRSNDPLGKKARWISDNFSEREINGTFRLRQGEPENQIVAELTTSAPDMIFISGKSPGIAESIFQANILHTVLKFANCPVLLSK